MQGLQLLGDLIQLRRRVWVGLSLLKADLAGSQTRLKMFELLAKDARFGKWYVGHALLEGGLTERLRQYITHSESHIAQIDMLLSNALDLLEVA